MSQSNDHATMDVYRIRIRGHLDQKWADWFDGFAIKMMKPPYLRGRP